MSVLDPPGRAAGGRTALFWTAHPDPRGRRSRGPKRYVRQMIDEFNRRSEFMLTIAPEGTRDNVGAWKTGFYHIAMGAGVPLVIGMMDYAKKTGGLGPAIWPTGDYQADMAKLAKIYATVTPKHPTKGMQYAVTGQEAQ